MPKIAAATLDEHRVNQRGALVRAGGKMLLESGISGVTPRAVTEHAGLARSSFYDYFPSRDDLLVAIAIEAIEEWAVDIDAALVGIKPGLDELRAFIGATMAMTAEGKHAIADSLREANLSPKRMDDLRVLHDALMRPLVRVISDLGLPSAGSAAMLVQGVLGAGVQLVSRGADHRVVAADIFRLLTRGLFG